MHKYLIVAGTAPFDNISMGDILSRRVSVGGNIGNLLFINGVAKLLMTDEATNFTPTMYRADFSSDEIEYINNTFDAFVLPMADAFRDDNINYLDGLTRFINKLSIPCYLIGVGLRASYEPELEKARKCDFYVKNFIRAVLNHSAQVGVRGQITADYLKKLGFSEDRDYTVIGCPSVSAFLKPELRGGGVQ